MLFGHFRRVTFQGEHLRHRFKARAFATALVVMGWAATAAAQTVIVKGAPANTTIELTLNGTAVATATPDAEGLATLVAPAAGAAGAPVRTNVFLDRCATSRRVHLAGSALAPPAEGGCVRETVPWAFLLGTVSTLVIDVAGPTPLVRITEGRAPEEWLRYGPEGAPKVSWGPSPTGLVVFGGGGWTMFNNLASIACGNVACTSAESPRSYAVGAAYWLTPMFGAEAQYIRPSTATAAGTGSSFSFDTSLETEILTVAGLIAAPLGRVRLYARAGMNRHATTLLTSQSVDDTTITTESGTITIPGDDQVFEFRTAQWGYVFGGGGEVWLTRHLAVYGDLSRAALGGDVIGIPEATLDHAGWLIQVGGRVRLGR
jgi:hypothetical protein